MNKTVPYMNVVIAKQKLNYLVEDLKKEGFEVINKEGCLRVKPDIKNSKYSCEIEGVKDFLSSWGEKSITIYYSGNGGEREYDEEVTLKAGRMIKEMFEWYRFRVIWDESPSAIKIRRFKK